MTHINRKLFVRFHYGRIRNDVRYFTLRFRQAKNFDIQMTENLGKEIIRCSGQILGTLSKRRRRRQRGHGETKDLIGRTIAQHVRFKTLYIS